MKPQRISIEVSQDYRAKGAFHQKCGEARGNSKKAMPFAVRDMKLHKVKIGLLNQEWLIMMMNCIMPEETLPIETIDHIVAFDYWNDRIAEL